MPWVEVNGTDISYVDEGSGPPIVFLHGNSSCAEAWFQQFAHFRGRYRCLAYDSVNHGHSSNSPRGTEEPDRVDELEGFLKALGLERPVLAGNSMGGNTLLRWAARHPDGARALIPSGMGVPREAAEAVPALPKPLDPDVLFLPTGDALTDRFRQTQPTLYDRYLRVRSTATRLEALRHPRQPSARTVAERTALAAGVRAVSSPMLIVVGTLDRLRPLCDYLHEIKPGSEYVVIPDAPHNVYYETAEAYNAALDRFLARLP